MTTVCDDDRVEREEPEIVGGGRVVGTPETILQLKPRDGLPPSKRADCDSHTAITRALAEYIATLQGHHNGRSVALARVEYDFPDREHIDEAVYPAAAVFSTSEGEYGDNLSPPSSKRYQVEPGLALLPVDTLMLDELRVDVECQDPEQRVGVAKMLEKAFRPVEWMTGFYLIAPHYHNAQIKFSLRKHSLPDTPELVAQGIRPISYVLSAWIQTYQLHRIPVLVQVRTPGTIDSADS